jgi:hypothetical protein
MGYLAKDVSEVDASDPGGYARGCAGGPSGRVELLWAIPIMGGAIRIFSVTIQEIEQRSPRARTFDLRLEDRITAKE